MMTPLLTAINAGGLRRMQFSLMILSILFMYNNNEHKLITHSSGISIHIAMKAHAFGALTFGWVAGRASGLWWGAGMVICLEQGADLHMAQLMPLPVTGSCFSKIQTGFTFLVPAHQGSPGQTAVKRVCVGVIRYKQCLCNNHKRSADYNLLTSLSFPILKIYW